MYNFIFLQCLMFTWSLVANMIICLKCGRIFKENGNAELEIQTKKPWRTSRTSTHRRASTPRSIKYLPQRHTTGHPIPLIFTCEAQADKSRGRGLVATHILTSRALRAPLLPANSVSNSWSLEDKLPRTTNAISLLSFLPKRNRNYFRN